MHSLFKVFSFFCERTRDNGGGRAKLKFIPCSLPLILYSVVFKMLFIAPFTTFTLTASTEITSSSSVQKLVNVSGDFILGAIFPIHRRGTGMEPCGEIQPEDGIQPLEALLYTIDKINRNQSLLPGVRLGVLALDTCDSTTYAMEQSMLFMKSFISHYNEFHEREFQCSDGSATKFRNGKFDRIVGVIGGQSSSVTIQVGSLLRLFKIPQISYMSTSPQLSNREKFPYFFRTVPSDVNQAHALIDILRHFSWKYVAVVYSDSEYGVHCYESLRELAGNDTICFSSPHRVIRYQFQASDYEQIMKSIKTKTEIRVILLILEKENAGLLMQAAKRLGIGNRYVWVGTDGWTGRGSVAMGIEDVLEGSLAIQPLVSSIGGFDEYFTDLTPEHTNVNPWFAEFWEHHFRCTLNPSNTSERKCNPETEKISADTGYSQQSFVHFVRDAAYAFATSLHNIHQDLCHGVPGVCEAMRHVDHVDGLKVFEYLRNVTFKDEEDNTFRFMEGDGPTRYTIVNFQKNPDKGTYSWRKVGKYESSLVNSNGKRELEIDETIRYRPSMGQMHHPVSSCATPCKSHQVKVRERVDTCCWKCRDCGRYQIKQDEFHCDECAQGTIPDVNHSVCLAIPETYINYKNPLAIGAIGVASFGILVTLFVVMVFWSYNDTPIIKAAGRELSYVLLFGIFLSFGVTFFIVAEPNRLTCGIMRFFLGFCPTLCYSAISTKTNRIARIFVRKPGPSVPKTKYISPTSQMIIVGLLTSVEVIINVIWIIKYPPATTYTYPDPSTKLRICEGVDTYRYMIGFIYPLILIGLCTIYAIQTRKTPEGFNETKYIGFTNYTIIIIWLAFVPLYLTSSSSSVRVVTLAISLSLSGLVELGCLFFPKIYIVLFKPEKNTKEVVMAPNRSSFLTLSNPASHVMYHSPQLQQSNGKCSRHQLHPEEIPISNNSSYSDPPSC